MDENTPEMNILDKLRAVFGVSGVALRAELAKVDKELAAAEAPEPKPAPQLTRAEISALVSEAIKAALATTKSTVPAPAPVVSEPEPEPEPEPAPAPAADPEMVKQLIHARLEAAVLKMELSPAKASKLSEELTADADGLRQLDTVLRVSRPDADEPAAAPAVMAPAGVNSEESFAMRRGVRGAAVIPPIEQVFRNTGKG